MLLLPAVAEPPCLLLLIMAFNTLRHVTFVFLSIDVFLVVQQSLQFIMLISKSDKHRCLLFDFRVQALPLPFPPLKLEGLSKRKGNVFLRGDLICTYTLPEYISDIYVNGLCIISKTRKPSYR